MAWLRRLLNSLRRDRLDRDIERELSFHLAERADQYRSEGLDDDEARRQARLRFGNPRVQAERTHDVDLARWIDTLMRNLRYAVRASRRAPGFALTVVLTIGAGIGANSAVFSAIDTVLLRPLPLPEGDRLVRVLQTVTAEADAETQIAPGRLEDWAHRSTAFEALTGYYLEDVSDTTGALPERIRRAVVAPRFLRVWGVAPVIGRDFTEAESRLGGPPAVLISSRYWRTRFAGDPAVLNRVIRIEGRPFSIAGVMPDTFVFPERRVDVWWPYPADGPSMTNTLENRKHRWYTGIGRLAPGLTTAQAQDSLAAVQRDLATEFPGTDGGIDVRIVPFRQALTGNVRSSLWLLYGAVSVLLLIACTNIASLWLSRASRREHEVAIRFSLGASRTAVIGELLTETALLTFAGAALGLLIAINASAAIHLIVPDLPRRETAGIDGRMLAYATTAAIFVTLLCGVLPAFRSTRAAAALASAGRTQTGGRHRVQWLLVSVQVGLAVVLLAGAGLLVRSIDALSRVAPGFDAGRVLALRMSANWEETTDRGALVQRIDRTVERLNALPGVHLTATSWALPGVPRRYQAEFELVEGRAPSDPPLAAEWRTVSATYFSVMRIPPVAGELCRHPRAGQPTAELMVNRSFVDTYFRGRLPIGSHLTWESASQRGRIAGVVENARELGLDREPVPTVYACDSTPSPFPWFLVRTDGDPRIAAAGLRAALQELEPLRSVYDMAPLTDRIGDAYAQTRLRTSLLSLFALSALALACLGIYGTVSYVVSLRRREVSLRLALGAGRNVVLRQMVWHAVRIVAIASVVGLAVTLALRRAIAGMLYGVSPSDPATIVGVLAMVIALGSLAALVPAARVTFVQPMRILRDE